MSNLELTQFNQDGIEILIDEQTGESFCSIRGYARLSGKDASTISRRLKVLHEGNVKSSQISTAGGLQSCELVPLETCLNWLLSDYHKNPSQSLFKTLVKLYEIKGLDTSGLLNLHDFNKGNKSGLKGSDRERQIQLSYHARYGGQLEFPTKHGRIDLLTDEAIYEFKIFRNYKNCLGQLLAYNSCVPNLTLIAVLFGVPKSVNFNSEPCLAVKSLLSNHGIRTEFLR